MVFNWHLQFVSINLYHTFILIEKRAIRRNFTQLFLTHTVIRVGVINDCSILKWVAPVLDTIRTLPLWMPRKTKEPQYSCYMITHPYNSRSCSAFAVGGNNFCFIELDPKGVFPGWDVSRLQLHLYQAWVFSMNKHVCFPFNMLLNVARAEAKLVATTRDVWEVLFI